MSQDRQGARRITRRLGGALHSGLLVVVPITLTLTLIAKVAEFVMPMIAPVARLLPDWIRFTGLTALVISLLGCMIIGFLADTSWGGRAVTWFEERVMGLIPGFKTVHAIVQSLFGRSEVSGWLPALVRPDEVWQAGFIVECHADGNFTAFVPGAPTPTAGDICILGPERVRRISAPPGRILRSLTLFGAGMEALKKDLLAGSKPLDGGD